MKRLVSYVVVFTLGAGAGGGVSAALSVRAGRLYGQMLRLSFAAEEEQLLSDAWRKEDFTAALRPASCGVDLLRGRAFNPEHSLWDITFPLMGAFVTGNTKYPVDSMARSEGLAMARLGVVWERLGNDVAAKANFVEAGKLMAIDDVAQVKRAGLATITHDKGAAPGK